MYWVRWNYVYANGWYNTAVDTCKWPAEHGRGSAGTATRGFPDVSGRAGACGGRRDAAVLQALSKRIGLDLQNHGDFMLCTEPAIICSSTSISAGCVNHIGMYLPQGLDETKFLLPANQQLLWLHDLHVLIDGILRRIPAMKVDLSGGLSKPDFHLVHCLLEGCRTKQLINLDCGRRGSSVCIWDRERGQGPCEHSRCTCKGAAAAGNQGKMCSCATSIATNCGLLP